MRKLFIVLIIVLLFFTAGETSSVTANGVLLKNTQLSHQLHLNSGILLKDMIVLPEGKYDIDKVAQMIDRLDQLPNKLLQVAHNENIKIILFNGKLTDQASAAYLQGKTPRGYPKETIWDHVPGIGGDKNVLVKIGYSEKGHGSVNLEYHELAHSLYHFVFNNEQIRAQIDRCWKLEANHLFPGQMYFLNYKEEFFAESFALYFYSKETNQLLEQKAPRTYQLFKSIEDRMDS